MKRQNLTLLAAGVALLLTAGDNRPPCAGDACESAQPGAAPAQMLHIDPATGKFVDAPVGPSSDMQNALGMAVSTSSDGLVIEQNTGPGGGIVMNLQGRFQNAATATIDANGKLNAPCISGSPTDGDDTSSDAEVQE